VSPLLLAELSRFWARPSSVATCRVEADAYVELIRSEAVVRADPAASPGAISADPDDEYLVDLARDAGADALVTGDAHLLDLRAIIPAMTPAAFLATLPDR